MTDSRELFENFEQELEEAARGSNPDCLSEEVEENLREIYERIVDAWNIDEELSDSDFDLLLEALDRYGFDDFTH